MLRRTLSFIREALRRYFIAGLLAFAPLGITVWAIAWIIQRLDNLLLPWVLKLVIPGLEEPPRLPLVGALFTLLVIILFGVVVRHFFGGELVRASERLLQRVPVARSIYGAVKQLVEAILQADQRQRFNRVVLVEYPRRGLYALAFTTGPTEGPLARAVPGRMVNCFVPTTPNPTSGFYLLAPEEDLIPLAIGVEEAFKVIMSAGLVAPAEMPREAGPEDHRPPAAGAVPKEA